MYTRDHETKQDDRETPLFVNPHYYHDQDWLHPRTVWGDVSWSGAFEYSDRIMEMVGYDKYRAAEKRAATRGVPDSAEYFEWFLRYAFDNMDIKLQAIKASYNQSNGHPLQLFGYTS